MLAGVPVVTGRGKKLGLGAGLMLGGAIEAGVCLLLALVFALISWPPGADAALDARGVPASATLTAPPRVMSTRNGVVRRVRLVARLADGTEVVLSSPPSPDYVEGATVAVEHLPDEPTIARVAGGKYAVFGPPVLAALGGASLVGFMLLAVGALVRRAQAASVLASSEAGAGGSAGA
jgi:hypothetical protein